MDHEPTFVVRNPEPGAAVIELAGEITPAVEGAVTTAYDATGDRAAVILDFTSMSYMNSGGIGLLVTLLIRAQREERSLMAVGLSEHYRQILGLTRLDEAIAIHDTEADALASVATPRTT